LALEYSGWMDGWIDKRGGGSPCCGVEVMCCGVTLRHNSLSLTATMGYYEEVELPILRKRLKEYKPGRDDNYNLWTIEECIRLGADESDIAENFFPLWVKHRKAFREYAKLQGHDKYVFIESEADKE